MFKRYLILLGAKTTAGGTVRTATSFMSYNDVHYALDGDQVDCPACGRQGVIKCVPPRLEEEAKERLEFGRPFPEILKAFEAVEDGDIATSVKRLARHEQVNILQKIIYNDTDTRLALDANQFAWVNELRGAAEIQLTLSAQCKPAGTFTSWFPRLTSVHLWNENDRMLFVLRAAQQFDRLLNTGGRPAIERAIQQIYKGGGVQ